MQIDKCQLTCFILKPAKSVPRKHYLKHCGPQDLTNGSIMLVSINWTFQKKDTTTYKPIDTKTDISKALTTALMSVLHAEACQDCEVMNIKIIVHLTQFKCQKLN